MEAGSIDERVADCLHKLWKDGQGMITHTKDNGKKAARTEIWQTIKMTEKQATREKLFQTVV